MSTEPKPPVESMDGSVNMVVMNGYRIELIKHLRAENERLEADAQAWNNSYHEANTERMRFKNALGRIAAMGYFSDDAHPSMIAYKALNP